MRLKDNPSACVEPEYRKERTCRECYFSQVNEKNQWTGSQRCWNAGCIEADTDETPTDKLRALLDERGIEWKKCEPLGANAITRFCVNGVWLRYVDYGDYCWIDYHEDTPLTPEQAIAATVGNEPWEPSKEWKAWHESLRHDNPTNVREVVESILFDAIEFGGDMGPNGNVCSGVDEGDVLTDGCINGWVKSIEEIAATVGTSTDLASRLREVTGLYAFAELFGFDWYDESDWSWHDVACAMADAIDATTGAGTCHIEERHGDWYCTGCCEMVGTCDPASELCVDGNAIELWRHCPLCGRRITKEVTE